MAARGQTDQIVQVSGFNGNSKLINRGLISADVAGGTLTINVGQFDNSGTVEARNGGKIIVP